MSTAEQLPAGSPPVHDEAGDGAAGGAGHGTPAGRGRRYGAARYGPRQEQTPVVAQATEEKP